MTDEVTPTWPDLITLLIAGRDLDADQVAWAMDEVMGGEAGPVPLAGFLVALRAKGETAVELRALAEVMLQHANRIRVPGPCLDIVGTGGDRLHSVNISTMSAVVIAAAGVPVVKHGNRAASSSSGSADVLEALGVNLRLSPTEVAQVAQDVGITFCFAQTFHPSMRHAGQVRAALGVGTAFNLLGPLTNPAQPAYSAVGVADVRYAPVLAEVFAARGQCAAVFRGDDGLDELTVAGDSTLWWVRDGQVSRWTLGPADVGVHTHTLAELRGGSAAENAEVARQLFAGAPGAAREAVLLNAGAALAVAAESAGHQREQIVAAVRAGVQRAAETIDSGAAAALLDRWIARTQRDTLR